MDKRVDIKTGFLCNNNCRFCVQAWKKNLGNKSTEQIRKDLQDAKTTGCTSVVFTGGEVSIRADFFELLSCAKQLGFTNIQVQSNGRMFAYMDFCRMAQEAGMTEFGPALHGHIPALHDWLTDSEGSFAQTTNAIRNARTLGLRVITNTVVVKPNFRYLTEIAQLLIHLGVYQYQMAFVHPVGNAHDNYDQMVPLISVASPYIHKALDEGIRNNVAVMAEAVPYCLMKGYEKYCSELYIPPTEIRDMAAYDADFTTTRKTVGKIKFEKCRSCRYDPICEGPWKEYPTCRGDAEFSPVIGPKVLTALEILKNK